LGSCALGRVLDLWTEDSHPLSEEPELGYLFARSLARESRTPSRPGL
jgi:hypothetical protein